MDNVIPLPPRKGVRKVPKPQGVSADCPYCRKNHKRYPPCGAYSRHLKALTATFKAFLKPEYAGARGLGLRW